jgi:hypothetical protein
MATKDRGMNASSEPAPINEGNRYVSATLTQLRPLTCIYCIYHHEQQSVGKHRICSV